ncbi:MAG: hypothetical protein ABIL62_06965 [Planctomycetota bacterium]
MSKAHELWERLMADTKSGKRKNSLKRVKKACDFIESIPGAITIAAVGRYCENEWDAPIAQSLRNDPKGYSLYINARKAEQRFKPGKTARNPEGDGPPISDEIVREYVNHLKAIIESQRRQINSIKREIKKLYPLDYRQVEEAIATGKPINPALNPAPGNAVEVHDSEADAIREFIQDGHLDKFDMEFTKDGHIVFGPTQGRLMKYQGVRLLRRIGAIEGD